MTLTTSSKILNFNRNDVVVEPFPHVLKQGFLNPEFYQRLKTEFPSDELFDQSPKLGQRAGRDLYRGDPAYDELLATSPAWHEFYEYLNSPSYIDDALYLFGDYLERFQCIINTDKIQFLDYFEDRSYLASWRSKKIRALRKVQQVLTASRGKNDLFVRMDLGQSMPGYGQVVHCDRPNRLSSMIIYFSDADEIQMDGGRLTIHEHLEKKPYQAYERRPSPEKVREVARVTPRENLGLFFLCSNNSYHAVESVKSMKGYREYIYISIASKAYAIW